MAGTKLPYLLLLETMSIGLYIYPLAISIIMYSEPTMMGLFFWDFYLSPKVSCLYISIGLIIDWLFIEVIRNMPMMVNSAFIDNYSTLLS